MSDPLLTRSTARASAPSLPGPLPTRFSTSPSRDAGLEKTERKQKWLAACRAALAARDPGLPAVLLEDLNILEPGHQPHYPFFAPFEYDFYRALIAEHGFVDAFRCLHPDAIEHSWVGRTGDGYRYDHAFCSAALGAVVAGCGYLHQPREDRLSDHSALTARLSLEPSPALLVSDPVAAVTPATLF
jgi:exodeoxyribonuclease III